MNMVLPKGASKKYYAETVIRMGYSKGWYGLQAVGKCAVYGAETDMGVNAPYPDGLKAIPPFTAP